MRELRLLKFVVRGTAIVLRSVIILIIRNRAARRKSDGRDTGFFFNSNFKHSESERPRRKIL